MRWAVEGNRYTDKISTDGFNPYGMSAAVYSCWPVFVIPMNLPPGVCMRSENMFVSMIIPGPKYPGKNMNVYLEPLVDDLVRGWEGRGIRTYDASKKEYFDMYVWYHTSLHDLPARALFCGWCTHGKWPCPQCRQAVTFFWLNKGGKYSCFDEARQFLERRHAYRSDVKSFKKGRVVRGPKPIPKTGTEIKAELDALQPSPDGNGFLGYGETHQWTHKPCLWKLPYFEFLELPHNIDVMHTEKNISEAIWSTIVDTEKTKDNIKARIDQEMWCDRPELNMQPPHGAKKTWTKPHAPFCLTKAQKREVFQWMKDSLFFPDGFAANWMRDDEQEDAGMDGDNAEDEAEDVCAPEDLSLLEAFRAGIDLDADGPPPGFIDDYCSFKFEDPSQRPPRGYSNILGGLLRWYFPGIVNLPTGGCDVAWRWAHYSLAEDPLGRGTAVSLLPNSGNTSRGPRARRMRAMMSYTSLQGREWLACTRARVQCVHDWHADRFVHMTKEDARDTLMQPWQYMQNPPQYVGNDERKSGQERSNVFAVLKKKMQRKTPDPEMGSVWVNPQSETQCTSYVSKFKQKYGEDALRPTLTLRLRCLRRAWKHGRLWFGGDGGEGAGPRSKGRGWSSRLDTSSSRHEMQQMQRDADDAAAASNDELADGGAVVFSRESSAPPPYSMPWMPPPPTQTPGTPVTVNNMNIIRSMNRGESSYTCAQAATCACSSDHYANANVHSINLLIDYMSQGNDDEAGGSGGGQG
ncbi:hypothetical protein QYE76_031760 [Lolium multiflorum]|uniref:Uncharacterized protein n=1 Tax=Lolium multiflorum TaxID=4521 RepID=A0AAD8VHQ2_LOLMU|nr:hypothetical protein QYE76_031760 [Lolium multiflorum]